MNIQGKLIIIGGAVDKGSFTETDLDKIKPQNLNFFEEGILKRLIKESKFCGLFLSKSVSVKLPLSTAPPIIINFPCMFIL